MMITTIPDTRYTRRSKPMTILNNKGQAERKNRPTDKVKPKQTEIDVMQRDIFSCADICS